MKFRKFNQEPDAETGLHTVSAVLLPDKRGGYKLIPREGERSNNAAANDRAVGSGAVRVPVRQDEKLLRSLEKLDQVVVYHSPALSAEQARQIYRDLLDAEAKKHRSWMIVNGLLLPFSAILTIIPGPNLVMAYLAWRTMAHYKARKGARKGREEIPLQFVPLQSIRDLEELLRRRLVLQRKQKIRAIGQAMGIENLDRWY